MLCYNKINLLENCNQLFICSICCDPKNKEYCQPFSTSTVSHFLEHQQYFHSSVSEIECVYCCCYIPSPKFIQHIEKHFSNKDLFTVDCPSCKVPIRQNIKSMIEHMLSRHFNETIVCPCCNQPFHSLEELKNHLISSQHIIFNCPFQNCIVKTHSKTGILNHLANKHDGSRYMKVDCQFNCVESLIQNPDCSEPCPLKPVAKLPLKTSDVKVEEPQLVDLPYSYRVLMKLSTGLDIGLQEDLNQKMEQYSKFKVRLEIVDGQKQFICSTCQYRSVHSLADVRKHILGCHCSVSTSYTRLCLRASRLDTNNLTLFSDRKLISFANEKLKKTDNEPGLDGSCDLSGLQLLEDSEPESGSNSGSHARPNKRQSIAGSTQGQPAKKTKLQPRQSNVTKMRSDSPVPEVGPPLERNENFDRVIQLNYSWAVLERLVSGQCSERYLPVLKQKMDVYSQHRILLTRRNGKRYFLCSHCPNCSPHGMNDIRKHILGVHARLPERFKSAAMYCSRMNRDNYGLLSDEELLKKNQDMVRWRSNTSQSQDEFTLETLASLQRSLTEDDFNNNNYQTSTGSDSKSHNVFLSGDNDNGSSPISQSFVPESVTSHYQNFSQMPLSALFTSILTNNNKSELSDESSPTSNVTANINGKGRSRRSLVLKSKSTNYNSQNTVVNNIS